MGRRFGQHFLARQSILEKIAEAACPDASPEAREPLVIEIGPGRGALTTHLLARAERVVAIEVDRVLVHYLAQKFKDEPRLTVVEADILKADLAQYGPAVIAGNLPYYITSPILEKVFSTPAWRRAVFLVQKEVANRVVATPGSRDYGYLTVQTQVHSRPEFLFDVSSKAFQPPPKVESAVFRLDPLPSQFDQAAEFLKFASHCFRHKRKTLRNNLIDAFPKEIVDALPEAGKRAEQLSVDQLASILRRIVSQA